MALLDDFKPFNFSEGVASVSITNNGMNFNQSVIKKLNYPTHVLLLIDEGTQRIAIKQCSEKDENAAPFYKAQKKNSLSVRWNGRDLLNTISSMMDWQLQKVGYRVEGVLYREENAIVFDLTKAVELK